MPSQARIGRRLAGYRIEEMIGRGGMGVVYRAEHLHLRRTVALKLLAPELAENEAFRDRFVRESRTAASIPHPNIVPVYDAGEADGLLYIAMRCVEGSDLRTLLRENHTLAPRETLWILRQVGSALDVAHEHGLVHRDVKPGNVLLDSAGAYLSDFGLTKPTMASTPYTVPGQLVGTINYVSPEQIRGDPLGPSADVYALACVLYECLAGEVPFPRESEVAALYAHLQDRPPSVTQRRPELPPAIDDVVARGLSKDPEDRPATCGELVETAEDALAELLPPASEPPKLSAPIRSPRRAARRSLTSAVTRLPSGRGWGARRARRAALLAGLLAVGAGGVAVALALSVGGHPRARPPPVSAKPPSIASGGTPKVVVSSVPVGRHPAALALGIGGVWVADAADGTLSRIDAVSGTVTGGPVSVGRAPVAVTEHAHTVFVASAGDSSVGEVDALSDRPIGAPVALGHVPRAMAAGVGDDTLWVAAADGTVVRVSRRSPRRVGSIQIGGSLRGIATARGEAWVTRADGTVIRLDTRRRRIKGHPIRVGRNPSGIAVGDGVVWVANQGSGTVTRLSAHSGRPLGQPIKVGRSPAAIAVGEGYVWVADSGDGSVTRLDPPAGRRAGRPVRVGTRPMAIRTGAGSVWVANRGSGTVSRISRQTARPRSR